MVCHSLAHLDNNFAALKNADMMTTTLTKALVQYLMAMTLPQEVGILHTREEKNPFVNVDMNYGRRSCLLSSSDLKSFQAETGIEITKGDVLSCETLAEFEDLIGTESEKVSVEKLSRLILHLTEVHGTVWNNLELVENFEDISDKGIINPAYIWPDYSVDYKVS